MRNRLATIAVLSIAAVIGTAHAAHAVPKGPGGFEQNPTTTTTAKPKGPGNLAPKPTTTTVPPKPGYQGPGDITTPQPDPVVDPEPPTTPGDDEAGVGEQPNSGGNTNTGQKSSDESIVDGKSVETIPVANTGGAASNDPTEAVATANHDGGLSPFVLLGFALLTAGLIAFVIVRRRGDEEDAEQF